MLRDRCFWGMYVPWRGGCGVAFVDVFGVVDGDDSEGKGDGMLCAGGGKAGEMAERRW